MIKCLIKCFSHSRGKYLYVLFLNGSRLRTITIYLALVAHSTLSIMIRNTDRRVELKQGTLSSVGLVNIHVRSLERMVDSTSLLMEILLETQFLDIDEEIIPDTLSSRA